MNELEQLTAEIQQLPDFSQELTAGEVYQAIGEVATLNLAAALQKRYGDAYHDSLSGTLYFLHRYCNTEDTPPKLRSLGELVNKLVARTRIVI